MALTETTQRVQSRGDTARSFLDLVANLIVIVAAAAVLALTVRNWRQPRQAHPEDLNAALLPETAQTLDEAAVLGSRAARVAIIEYSDFQCPYCAGFVQSTWPSIKHDYVDPGKVITAFRHLPLPAYEYARTAAIAAECAGRQGRFWEMHDLLFEHQSELHDETGKALTSHLGLAPSTCDSCVHGQGAERVDNDRHLASTLGVTGTPTFLIGVVQKDRRTVNVTHVLVGNQPIMQFRAVLDDLLSRNEGRFSWFGLR